VPVANFESLGCWLQRLGSGWLARRGRAPAGARTTFRRSLHRYDARLLREQIGTTSRSSTRGRRSSGACAVARLLARLPESGRTACCARPTRWPRASRSSPT
jgi:hypothetical protein